MMLVILMLLTFAGLAASRPAEPAHASAGDAARPGDRAAFPRNPTPDTRHPINTHPISAEVRFLSVDLVIDSKDHPLAVYQLEFTASKDTIIVGIEGGAHQAFREPPYFDPAAIQQERVIVAAFSTAEAEKLPRGKVRVATIHLQITGDGEPQFQLKPSVIATVDGKAIEATATVESRKLDL